MNALQLLRAMHADSKQRFKLILGADDAPGAAQQWTELQPLLTLHEQMEDRYLYTPVFEETGPGTPLGNWAVQHEADASLVQQLIQAANRLDPASPDWRTAIGRVMDALAKHVIDEEGQVFGRIDALWDAARLEHAGQQMQQQMNDAAAAPRKLAPARRKR